MLLEFSIENYRSFWDRQVLSLLPDEGKNEYPENIFLTSKKAKILKASVVYGANASGKSNLIRSMLALRQIIYNSANHAPDTPFEEYDPFRFNPTTEKGPTQWGIDFLIDQIRYHYEVSILKYEVVREELFFYPQSREAKLFVRDRQQFEFGDYLKGQKAVIAELTGPNQLYLSKAAQNNLQQLVEVYQFFSQDFMSIPFLDNWVDSYYMDRIAKELIKASEHTAFRQNFFQLISSFDTGIVDFHIEKNENPSDPDYEIFVDHKVFDDVGKEQGIKRHSIKEESTGTQKLFVLGGLVLRALMNGRIIIIDEFERSLHPFITRFIIQMFHNPKINTQGAQLVIATHDTHLLANSELRRDQVWIVEKNKEGASELYALSDVNGIRSNVPFEKWYLSGRFGGVPGLSHLNLKLNFQHEEA